MVFFTQIRTCRQILLVWPFLGPRKYKTNPTATIQIQIFKIVNSNRNAITCTNVLSVI